MSERDEPTGAPTVHDSVPLWNRDRDWWRAEAGRLEAELSEAREFLDVARRALADACKMQPSGLRDHFAAAALGPLVAIAVARDFEAGNRGGIGIDDDWRTCAARDAFAFADAMLAERDASGRRGALAAELAEAMIAVEELEAADDPGDGVGLRAPNAELGHARLRVTRAFAAVLEEWRRR